MFTHNGYFNVGIDVLHAHATVGSVCFNPIGQGIVT